MVANFPFIKRSLAFRISTSFEKGFSLDPLISLEISKKTQRFTVLYFEPTRTDPAIGVSFDFKVNTPLKSHQSKIESLTVARADCFTFSQTMGTATTLGVCIHRM